MFIVITKSGKKRKYTKYKKKWQEMFDQIAATAAATTIKNTKTNTRVLRDAFIVRACVCV